MPSNDRPEKAMAAVAAPRERFHAAVAAAVDEVRGLLDESRAPEEGPSARAAGSLGAFAAGRIDAERFAALFAGERVLDGRAVATVEAALATLTEIAAATEDAYAVDVPTGGNLVGAVDATLAHFGRAFAAARVVEGARSGGRIAEDPAAPFPFARWNRAERAIAPPLVVAVDGADLRVGALAPFLDGGQQIVLLVRGPAAPAPLVRLLTPGTLVLQATDTKALEGLKGWEGPAVAAVLPEGAAGFVHAPTGGTTLPERLGVGTWPAAAPTRPVGGISVAQQAEELAQLRALTELAARPVTAAADEGPAVQPTDRLAAWLLRQTHLTDVA